ncbi:MAG: hypothetical protein AAF579_15590 [Cyanobacteria bacterium P01_C01_bin.118]
MSPDGLSIGSTQPTLAIRQDAIEQAVGNLMHHSQHIRIKKLLFSVCYGGWENEGPTLDSISTDSLVNTFLGRCSTLQQCRESLHKKANSLNRKKVYVAIANLTVHYLRNVFPATGAITPSTDQQVANLSASVQSQAKAEIYKPVLNALNQSANLEIIKTFLGYLGQAPDNIADTAGTDLLSLVQMTHRHAPTPMQLKQRMVNILKHQPSKVSTQVIAREILRAFRPLYRVTASPMAATPDSLTSLEQELAAKCDVNQVRVLLYSVLYGPYADSPLQRQILQNKTLRDLLQETFEYCPNYSDFESKLTIIAHCLETSDQLNRALKVILVALYRYYSEDKKSKTP